MRTLVAVMISMAASPALAAPCDAPYTVDDLLGDLIEIEQTIASGEDQASIPLASEIEEQLGCLDEVLPPMILGRTYRAIAIGVYAGGDEQRATDWLATALEIDGDFEFGTQDLPSAHPILSVYRQLQAFPPEEPVRVPDQELLDGATHWLDGRQIQEPAATQHVPHLYQVEDDAVRSWLIVGNAFPDEVLVDDEPEVEEELSPREQRRLAREQRRAERQARREARRAEREAEEEVADADPGDDRPEPERTDDGAVVLTHDRPPEQIPLIVGGSAVMLGAGGLYYASHRTNRFFHDEANSPEELRRYFQLTNGLVVASAVTLAVGAGSTTWGVILSDGHPIPSVQIRF